MFAAVAIILVPAIFIGLALFKEATAFYNHISSGQIGNDGFLNIAVKFFENKISIFIPEFSIDLGEYLKNFASWIVGHLDSFFSSFFKILIGLLLMIISLFYFLKDGERIVKRLIVFSPLADSYDEQIMKRVGLAINSIVRGSLIIALTKGFLTALGFAIFGIPNPILWGIVSAFTSFIPVVGSSIVIIPAILYLFVASSYAGAIGFAVWGVALVGLSDNLLSPILMKKGCISIRFLFCFLFLAGWDFSDRSGL